MLPVIRLVNIFTENQPSGTDYLLCESCSIISVSDNKRKVAPLLTL